jgi:hypothetical protein
VYDFETDGHFEELAHLTIRDKEVTIDVAGWTPEDDGAIMLWFDRRQYFCRVYKSVLVAEVKTDGSEEPVYHDMLPDFLPVEDGKRYHVWITAEDKTLGADGTLRVTYAGSGQGHVKLHKRVAPDGEVVPTKKKKKSSLLSRLVGK